MPPSSSSDLTPVSQSVVQSIADTGTEVLGQSPSVAMGMLYQMEAQAFGMSMLNASQSQDALSKIGNAAVSVAVYKIMSLMS